MKTTTSAYLILPVILLKWQGTRPDAIPAELLKATKDTLFPTYTNFSLLPGINDAYSMK